MMKHPRFTEKEWEAIEAALAFVDCGEDPWEDEASEDDDSPTMKGIRSALAKLRRNA
jgi:hypothetical protein